MGAWFEAKIVKITSKTASASSDDAQGKLKENTVADTKANDEGNLDVNKNVSDIRPESDVATAVSKVSEVDEDGALYSIQFDG